MRAVMELAIMMPGIESTSRDPRGVRLTKPRSTWRAGAWQTLLRGSCLAWVHRVSSSSENLQRSSRKSSFQSS